LNLPRTANQLRCGRIESATQLTHSEVGDKGRATGKTLSAKEILVYSLLREDHDAGLFCGKPALNNLAFAKGDSPSFTTPHGLRRLAGKGTEGFCFMTTTRNRRGPSLIGQRFGRWSVLAESYPPGLQRMFCDVRCDCGTEKTIGASRLRSGESQSCGCLQRDAVRAQKTRLTHGACNTPEWNSWRNVIQRIDDPNIPCYHHYGGRGLTLCLGLRTFEGFVAAVGMRPAPGYSVDRKDNEGGYWCGKCDECTKNGWAMNVRWATAREQSENRRDNVLLTIDGETKCVSAWSRVSGIAQMNINKRLSLGWSAEDAVFTPVKRKEKSA
jgi:hypothetical protein